MLASDSNPWTTSRLFRPAVLNKASISSDSIPGKSKPAVANDSTLLEAITAHRSVENGSGYEKKAIEEEVELFSTVERVPVLSDAAIAGRSSRTSFLGSVHEGRDPIDIENTSSGVDVSTASEVNGIEHNAESEEISRSGRTGNAIVGTNLTSSNQQSQARPRTFPESGASSFVSLNKKSEKRGIGVDPLKESLASAPADSLQKTHQKFLHTLSSEGQSHHAYPGDERKAKIRPSERLSEAPRPMKGNISQSQLQKMQATVPLSDRGQAEEDRNQTAVDDSTLLPQSIDNITRDRSTPEDAMDNSKQQTPSSFNKPSPLAVSTSAVSAPLRRFAGLSVSNEESHPSTSINVREFSDPASAFDAVNRIQDEGSQHLFRDPPTPFDAKSKIHFEPIDSSVVIAASDEEKGENEEDRYNTETERKAKITDSVEEIQLNIGVGRRKEQDRPAASPARLSSPRIAKELRGAKLSRSHVPTRPPSNHRKQNISTPILSGEVSPRMEMNIPAGFVAQQLEALADALELTHIEQEVSSRQETGCEPSTEFIEEPNLKHQAVLQVQQRALPIHGGNDRLEHTISPREQAGAQDESVSIDTSNKRHFLDAADNLLSDEDGNLEASDQSGEDLHNEVVVDTTTAFEDALPSSDIYRNKVVTSSVQSVGMSQNRPSVHHI